MEKEEEDEEEEEAEAEEEDGSAIHREGEGHDVRRFDARVARARPLTLIRNCGVLRI